MFKRCWDWNTKFQKLNKQRHHLLNIKFSKVDYENALNTKQQRKMKKLLKRMHRLEKPLYKPGFDYLKRMENKLKVLEKRMYKIRASIKEIT